jgi:hypothetical protein
MRPRNSRLGVWIISLAAACGAIAWPGETAQAQSITAPGAQSTTHAGTDANQVFPEVTWQLTSGGSSFLGCTAQWSCGPFTHTGDASFKADTRLDIRIISSSGSANWTALVPSDQTNFGGGDQTVSVTAQSTAKGNGQVGLTVTFVDTDFSRLAAGSYTATVTGTISAN